ncbi:MAG: 4Fe-4S dicluster domain-containing protein [Candidatus Brocadiaceae bacterium]|nr:4Fe-4S dicluster domain-containing protein [Candidatus Brocadiaceae bacterium]
MLKTKENIRLRGGFHLQDSFPIRFYNVMERMTFEGQSGEFVFSIPIPEKIAHVIVNVCPTEPWALPSWVVLEHKTAKFLNKLKALRSHSFPDARCYLAVNKAENEPVVSAEDYAGDNEWLEVFALDAKYPQDDPVLLAKTILGIEMSFGKDPAMHGILILDAQTVLALYESGIRGQIVDSRFIALSGSGLRENEVVRVPLGMPIEKVIRHKAKKSVKHRVFVNGPLRGKEITDLSQKIDWSIDNIVVLEELNHKVLFPMLKQAELTSTTNMLGELRRCVFCNFCDDICPVDLEPALYYHAYERREKGKARLFHLEKCIECGLCSYICPSKLELLQIIKECKALK